MIDNEINATTTATCPVIGHQSVELCVPVSVHPFAKVGRIVTKCFGKPIIKSGDVCKGEQKENCNFTIKQTISIEVPIEFGTTIDTGETFITCGKPSGEDEDEDTDNNCDEDEDNDEDEDEDEDNENEQKRTRIFGL